MSSPVEITVNGVPVAVPPGATLLAAVRAAGVELPTLCNHEGLEPYGACRLCMVSVVEPRRELAAACCRPAEPGMAVDTRTPEAAGARRLALEFLLGRCPGSQAIRALAASEGVTASRFGPSPQSPEVPEGSDELCTLCGLCVRVCREAIGAVALTFAGRGGARRVTTAFDFHAESCVGCGACAEVCPTGAIRIEDRAGRRYLHTWNTTIELEPCPECGNSFAPRPLSLVEGRFPEVAQTWRHCPACRRRRTARQWVGSRRT